MICLSLLLMRDNLITKTCSLIKHIEEEEASVVPYEEIAFVR
jgi:hypothetical protein